MIRLIDIYHGGKIDQADVDFLYQLLAERPSEANISHREMPTPEQHRQFVHRRPYEVWYLITGAQDARPGLAGPPMGFVPVMLGSAYITKAREVGIFILREHWGKGFARTALEALRAAHPGPLLANVAPLNERSHRFFKAAGGRLIQYTYEL